MHPSVNPRPSDNPFLTELIDSRRKTMRLQSASKSTIQMFSDGECYGHMNPGIERGSNMQTKYFHILASLR